MTKGYHVTVHKYTEIAEQKSQIYDLFENSVDITITTISLYAEFRYERILKFDGFQF